MTFLLLFVMHDLFAFDLRMKAIRMKEISNFWKQIVVGTANVGNKISPNSGCTL